MQRLRKKATVYSQDLVADRSPNQDGMGKIDVDGVVQLHKHYIIPLTKEVEVPFVPQVVSRAADRLMDRLITRRNAPKACPMYRSRSLSVPCGSLECTIWIGLPTISPFPVLCSGPNRPGLYISIWNCNT